MGFIALDSNFHKELMLTKRTFTRMEAAFCLTYDLNYNRPWSINGYSTMWGWSRHKTRDFVTEISSQRGSVNNGMKNKKGHPIRLISNGSESHRDMLQNQKGHPIVNNINGFDNHEDTNASIGTCESLGIKAFS